MNTTTEERLAIKKKKRMVNRKKYEEEVRRNQNDSSADGENSDTFFEEESFDPNQPISLEDALSFTKISRYCLFLYTLIMHLIFIKTCISQTYLLFFVFFKIKH